MIDKILMLKDLSIIDPMTKHLRGMAVRNSSNKNDDRNEAIEKVLEELVNIDKELEETYFHDTKRRLSFDKLDRLLNSCDKDICPHINPKDHLFLIDISAACYIRERAYYYSIDKIGFDDSDRYRMAENRLMKVFKCPVVNPELDSSLFEKDCATTKIQHHINECARKRKAYWRFMTRRDSGNKDGTAKNDYCDACGILDSTCGSKKSAFNMKNKGFWLDNLDIINGVDLFRYCLFRSKP